MSNPNSGSISANNCLLSSDTATSASTPSPSGQSLSSEKMIEALPQQPIQLQYPANRQQQQSISCRHSAGLFQYCAANTTPASPSPLGSGNANLSPTATMMMRETTDDNKNNIKIGGSSPGDPTIFSSPSSFSRNIFSFSPTSNNHNNNYNTVVTPPPKQSMYEERFRKSGGSNNPFTKIFGSSPSPSPSGGNGSATRKHRQLFLNKVKQNRDNARFNSRGETLMMMECHSEQRDWDERMRRKADTIYRQDHLLEGNEEEEEEQEEENAIYNEQSALEQFLMQEEEEEPYMDTALMSPSSTKTVRSGRSSFCGNDGDYDDIFMELVDDAGEYRQSEDTSMSF